mmetsp:Transcript_37513/g.94700  ORF Transcript_37513/g.94700 Transcript_37513/m.94700 type:complete len:353 (-) Transcript_37513:348-1406(-)
MGCVGSKHDAADKYKVAGDAKDSKPKGQASNAKPTGQINNYAPAQPKPKLDPADFRFVNLKGEVKVKPPGSINGQAFTIDKCEDCDLYILDNCAQVQIDECKNCRIFIGPTDGSIFMRDSSDCKCALIGRQVRLRDVTKTDIALFCRTRPILESSSDIGLTCYTMNYAALSAQLKAAKLDVVHNFWSHVYDFTPKSTNWHYLEPGTTVEALLGGDAGFPEPVKAALGAYGGDGPLITTWGDRNPPAPDYLFVIFPQHKADSAMQFINQSKHEACVLRCNKAEVNPEVAGQMAHFASWARSVERDISAGMCIGVELSGAGVRAKLCHVAHVLGGHDTEQEPCGAAFRHLGITE